MSDDEHAWAVERQVNSLDRCAIDAAYVGRGSPAYDPIPLLKMVLYQYLKGNQSPATWYHQARDHRAMQWLGRGYRPARRTWYEFRDRATKFIEWVHQQLIDLALESRLLEPSVAVQDGTSIAACASRHRMLHRPTLHKRKEQLRAILQGQSGKGPCRGGCR